MHLFRHDRDARVQRGGAVEWSLIDGMAVLVNIEDGVVLKLDEVGTAVWLALDGKKTIPELVHAVCERYEVGEKTARKDVLRFMRHLKSSEAIDYVNEKGRAQ